ncbi:MAG: hypothetical protein ACYCSA_03670 [Thermoplasmataceae archaeon]
MGVETVGSLTVIMDSDVMIALLKSGITEVLGCIPGLEFLITDVNYEEIRRGAEAPVLEEIVMKQAVRVETISEPMALIKFAELQHVIDAGESAVITMASLNGGHVAMHDKAGRRIAIGQLSEKRVHRLEDLIVEAVRNGCLSVENANLAAGRLRDANDYLPCFADDGIQSILLDPNFGISSKNMTHL